MKSYELWSYKQPFRVLPIFTLHIKRATAAALPRETAWRFGYCINNEGWLIKTSLIGDTNDYVDPDDGF